MQAQHSNKSNTVSIVSAKQLLMDEIYAPKPSKESANVLSIKANVEPNKLQKSEFFRFLEAYGDCV